LKLITKVYKRGKTNYNEDDNTSQQLKVPMYYI
jgi:hypothetical protein